VPGYIGYYLISIVWGYLGKTTEKVKSIIKKRKI
jgi:hypothetical protein